MGRKLFYLKICLKSFHSQDGISNSCYSLPYNSFVVNLENLVLDQLIIPQVIFFSILITFLVDVVLTL